MSTLHLTEDIASKYGTTVSLSLDRFNLIGDIFLPLPMLAGNSKLAK